MHGCNLPPLSPTSCSWRHQRSSLFCCHLSRRGPQYASESGCPQAGGRFCGAKAESHGISTQNYTIARAAAFGRL
eukprot:3829572-Amphidinium_carterae.1